MATRFQVVFDVETREGLQKANEFANSIGATLQKVESANSKLEQTGSSSLSRLNSFYRQNQQVVESTARSAGVALGAISAAITGVAVVATSTAVSFESAFLGVVKTVDATEAQLAGLRVELAGMTREVPLAAEEIFGIAEAAGQLGIRAENVTEFTRVMADLGATTNLSAQDAAVQLARLDAITGGTQANFDRLGATVVDLGNNMETTEAEIVSFALRIAGAGQTVGLSQDQILAFAATLSSVGLKAESAGTSISRVMLELNSAVISGGESLQLFADIAGQSTDDFAQLFRDDAAMAVNEFIMGLGRVIESGEDVTVVLEALGLDGLRVLDTMQRTANAGEKLGGALDRASEAWESNSALAQEAAIRYGSAESQLQLFQNIVRLLADEIGQALIPILISMLDTARPVLDWAIGMAQTFRRLPQPIQTVAIAVGGLGTALAGMSGTALIFLPQILNIVKTVKALGGVSAITTGAVSGLAAVFTPLTIAVAAAGAAVLALTSAWISYRDAQDTANIAAADAESVNMALGRAVNWSGDQLTNFLGTVDEVRIQQIRAEAVTRAMSEATQEQRDRYRDIVETIDQFTAGTDDANESANTLADDGLPNLGTSTDDTKEKIEDLFVSVSDVADVMGELDAAITREGPTASQASSALEDLVNQHGELIRQSPELQQELLGLVNRVMEMGGSVDMATLSLLPYADAQRLSAEAAAAHAEELERVHARVLEVLAVTSDPDALALDFSDDAFTVPDLEFVISPPDPDDIPDPRNFLQKFGDQLSGFFKRDFGAIMSDVTDIAQNVFGVEIPAVAQAGLNAVVKFVQGDFIGAFLSAGSAIVGLFKGLFGKTSAVDEITKQFGLELSDSLTQKIQEIGDQHGRDYGAAFRLALGDVIEEVGVDTRADLDRFLGDTRNLFADFDRGTISAAEAVGSIGDNVVALLPAFDELGVSLDVLSGPGGVLADMVNRMNMGQLSASEVEAAFNQVLAAAVEMGLEGTDALVQLAESAGLSLDVLEEYPLLADGVTMSLSEMREEAERLRGEVVDTSRSVLDGVQALIDASRKEITTVLEDGTEEVTEVFRLTKNEVNLAASGVVAAFGAMQAAGVPMRDILAELGDEFVVLSTRAAELGIELPEGFNQLARIAEVMNEGPIQRSLEKLDALTQVTQGLGELGLLTAEQFDTFGDTVDSNFRRLVEGGLSSEEALAALGPQLQLIHDLSVEQGLELDRNTQKLLDQAMAQGVVKEAGLSTTDALTAGFDGLFQRFDAMLQNLGVATDGFFSFEEAGVGSIGQVTMAAEAGGEQMQMSFSAATAAMESDVDQASSTIKDRIRQKMDESQQAVEDLQTKTTQEAATMQAELTTRVANATAAINANLASIQANGSVAFGSLRESARASVDGALAEYERMQRELVGASIIPDMVDMSGAELLRLPEFAGESSDDMLAEFDQAAQDIEQRNRELGLDAEANISVDGGGRREREEVAMRSFFGDDGGGSGSGAGMVVQQLVVNINGADIGLDASEEELDKFARKMTDKIMRNMMDKARTEKGIVKKPL